MADTKAETAGLDPVATSANEDPKPSPDDTEAPASVADVDCKAESAEKPAVERIEDKPADSLENGANDIRKSIEASPEESKKSGRSSDSRRGDYKHRDGNKRPYQDYSANVKSDYTSQKESSDPDEIREQVEFYFSDSNLPMDKFLYDKVGGSANRPVSIKVLHSFKRMRHFQPYSAVIDALKESKLLDVTENEEVKRKVPLDESSYGQSVEEGQKKYEDKALSRSIYAKGFGQETPTTQFDIEAFFGKYGKTNAIRLRRTQEKIFKGSVFVEFDSEDTQKAFLELDPKPKWNDQELLIKSKHDYVEEKKRDIESGKIKPNGPYRGRDGHRGSRDNRDWRERRDEDRKRGFREDRGRGGRNTRGRGRNFRGRGGRGGNDREEKMLPRDPHQVPKIQITAEMEKDITDKAESQEKGTSTNGESKKRGREESDATEGQPESKKVDTKEEK